MARLQQTQRKHVGSVPRLPVDVVAAIAAETVTTRIPDPGSGGVTKLVRYSLVEDLGLERSSGTLRFWSIRRFTDLEPWNFLGTNQRVKAVGANGQVNDTNIHLSDISCDVGQVIDSARICKVAEPEKDVSNLYTSYTGNSLHLLMSRIIKLAQQDKITITSYEWKLSRAKRLARIAHSTITLVVPDPQGCRIGSSAATLNAIIALAKYYVLHFDSHVMSRMPALPLSINDELADVILPGMSQRLDVAEFSGLQSSVSLTYSRSAREGSFFDVVAAQLTSKTTGTSPVKGETVAKLKVAINGFGGGVKNVGVQASHLLKYDSMLGTFKADVQKVDNETISVDGKLIKVVSNRDPLQLPWAELGIDIVIEGTGVFVDGPGGAGKHIQAGAKKVIIIAPAKGADIPTYVVGVNEKEYDHDVANIVRKPLIANLMTCKRQKEKLVSDDPQFLSVLENGFDNVWESVSHKLEIAIEQKNVNRELNDAFHRLKGSSMSIGAKKVTTLCLAFEDHYSTHNYEA
ncbi:hypothetical protein AgCh_032935 [Apium graveolens]